MKKLILIFIILYVCVSTVFAQKPELVIPATHDIWCHEFSKDEKYFLTACSSITLWEIESGKEIATYSLPNMFAITVPYTDPVTGEKGEFLTHIEVQSIKFTTDSKFMAFLNSGFLIEWNMISKK